MKELLSIGEQVFKWTWTTSVQTAVLVLLILLLQKCLGRWLTPSLRYALSFLILCRLLLPIAPSSSLSLENLLTGTTQPTKSVLPVVDRKARVQVSSQVSDSRVFPLATVLGIGWSCGALCLALLAIWRYRGWRRSVQNGKKLSDPGLVRILDGAREAMGIRRPVGLLLVSEISSPAVFGIRRIRLLLPKNIMQRLTEEEWRFIFMHEMAHVRRNDTLLNMMLMAIHFLHWFNPLIWLGLRRLRADRELLCDAMVLKRLEPRSHADYIRVLLKLIEAISLGPQVFSSAVPVVTTKSEIKRRVLSIKHYREPRWTARFATGALVFALGILTFTHARERAAEPEVKSNSSRGLVNLSYGPTADQMAATNVLTDIQIKFIGPSSIKERDVRAQIHVQAGKPFSPTAVDNDVKDLYATGLFYNVRVAAEFSPDGKKLVYILQCNPRLVEMRLSGNSRFSDAELRKCIASKIDQPFSEKKLFLDCQAIQDKYKKAGYPGTVAKYTYARDTEAGTAKVTITIAERQ
jgi:bla regulator protein BlaR1